MYEIDKVSYLRIGQQGENQAVTIELDMTSWADEHPDASFAILFKPYNEDLPSPVYTTYDEPILTWVVGSSVTQNVGVGYTEIRAFSAGGLIKKSKVIPTSVEISVSGGSSVTPPAYADWVNNVLGYKEAAETAQEAAEAAQAAAEASQTAVNLSLAPAYSTSATYKVGDYCLYNAKLYMCKTAIETAEEWTAAHWTQVTFTDGLKATGAQGFRITGDGFGWIDQRISANDVIASADPPSESHTDYIPVIGGQRLYFRTHLAQYAYCYTYDANKVPIASYRPESGTSATAYEVDITAPQNACYVRLSCYNTYLSDTELLVGGAVSAISQLVSATETLAQVTGSVEDLTQFVSGGSYTARLDMEKGGFDSSTYAPITNNYRCRTRKFLYVKNTLLRITIPDGLYANIVTYDDTKTVITMGASIQAGTTDYAATSAYVRVQLRKTDGTAFSSASETSGFGIVVFQAADMNTAYVSTTGSDSNAGTKAAPFATLERAFLGKNVKTVIVAAGEYNQSVNLSDRDVKIIGEGGYAHFTGNVRNGTIRLTNCRFELVNIEVSGNDQSGFLLQDSVGTLRHCYAHENGDTIGNGFDMRGSNVTLYGCYAYQNVVDGFNAHDTTDNVSVGTLFDCIAEENGDDGVSYHENGRLIVFGGVYAGNAYGGIVPHNSCYCEVHNALIMNNTTGIEASSGEDTPASNAKTIATNCLIKGNTTGIFAKYYDVLSVKNIFAGNGQDKQIDATATIEEY